MVDMPPPGRRGAPLACLSVTLKKMISSSPSQNNGMDCPKKARVVKTASKRLYWRAALIAPIGIASSSEQAKASSESCSVLGRRSPISAITGRLVTSEVPKSPRRALPSQLA